MKNEFFSPINILIKKLTNIYHSKCSEISNPSVSLSNAEKSVPNSLIKVKDNFCELIIKTKVAEVLIRCILPKYPL